MSAPSTFFTAFFVKYPKKSRLQPPSAKRRGVDFFSLRFLYHGCIAYPDISPHRANISSPFEVDVIHQAYHEKLHSISCGLVYGWPEEGIRIQWAQPIKKHLFHQKHPSHYPTYSHQWTSFIWNKHTIRNFIKKFYQMIPILDGFKSV